MVSGFAPIIGGWYNGAMPGKRGKVPRGKCRVEVSFDEEDRRSIGIVCEDNHGNETMRVGFPSEVAKALAYKILNIVYRIEHGQSLPGDVAVEQRPEEDGEEA